MAENTDDWASGADRAVHEQPPERRCDVIGVPVHEPHIWLKNPRTGERFYCDGAADDRCYGLPR